MIKSVMFDLDDTIFDHKYSRLCALLDLKSKNKFLSKVPIEKLEREHEILLVGNYTKVLDKVLTINDSMIERTFLLFQNCGIRITEDEAVKYTDIFRQEYENNRRGIPGVKELLMALKKSVKVGIVSNGTYDIQMEKVRICQVEDLIDFIILSEEVGFRKPDKAIFQKALSKCNAKPEEAIFIGDSWNSDIIGASDCGIKTAWLNRYNYSNLNDGLAYEIQSYEDIAGILNYIQMAM